MPVTFQPLSAWRAGRAVVHVKGFAGRLDYSNAAVAACADALLAALRDRAAQHAQLAVAFDGDDLAAGSFTDVVRRAHEELGLPLVAFKYERERAAFERSWRDRPVECFLAPEPPDGFDGCRYARLGLTALEATGAAEALCLGGGPVVARELRGSDALPPPARTFVLFPATRPGASGGIEASALLEHRASPRLVVVDAAAPPPPPPAPPLRLSSADAVVKLSRLAGAGLGLFAARRFAVGEVLLDYGGDVLGTKDAMRLGDKSYLMRLGGDVYVDARRRDDVQARYINDARDKRVHNVAFRKLPDLRKAEVVVSRPVDAGDEFYASYGTFYWLSLDMRGEVSARLPEDQVRALVAKEAAFWDDAPPKPPEPPEGGA